MVDVFSRQQRSEIMSRVKGRENAATEIRLIHIFREYGIHGWRRRSSVFGRPDFIFAAAKLAIFVDGCFWHGCSIHGQVPASNRAFWTQKIDRNRARDKLVVKELRRLGWKVIRIWQHDLKQPRKV